jgi:thymidylate synthase ThyX
VRVTLLSYTRDAERLCASAAHSCYSDKGASELMEEWDEGKNKRWLGSPLASGHHSVIEHANYTFSIEGVSRSCYDEKTEVLTSSGWKYFRDVKSSDKILSVDHNGFVQFQSWTNPTRYYYEGDMHHYVSQNVDLLITPDHNLYIKKYDVRKEDSFHLVPSDQISVNRFYMTKAFRITNDIDDKFTICGYKYYRNHNYCGKYQKETGDYSFNRLNFYKFLAWFISEGSIYYNEKENSATINITQLKKENRDRITNLIESMGLHAFSDANNIKLKSLTLANYLKQIGKCHEKQIPLDLFDEFNQELASAFLAEYVKGDGSEESNGHRRIYTTSKMLADQLQILAHIAGYSAKVWIDDRRGQGHYSDVAGNYIRHNLVCYVVSLSCKKRNNRPIVKRNKHLSIESYRGMVYCLEVPGHLLFVRRNGITMWCGNCTHQLVRHRMASFSQQSQRYVDMKDADYIVPASIAADPELEARYRALMDSIWNEYRALSKKVPVEDARYVLPNACSTNITVTMNARELWHFFELRTCNRSQSEIREVADEMLRLAREASPFIFKNAGPPCISQGKCPEGKMSCGKPRTELRQQGATTL